MAWPKLDDPFELFCAKAAKLKPLAGDDWNGSLVVVESDFFARSLKLNPPPLPNMVGAGSLDFELSIGVEDWVGVFKSGDLVAVTGVTVVDDGNLNENPEFGVSFGLVLSSPFVLPPKMFVVGDFKSALPPNVAAPPKKDFDSFSLSAKRK